MVPKMAPFHKMDLFSKHGPFDLEADNGSGIKRTISDTSSKLNGV